MAQIQFRDDDTNLWIFQFGRGLDGEKTISSNTTEANVNNSINLSAGSKTTSALSNFSSYAGRIVKIVQSRGTNAGVYHYNYIESIDGSNIATLKYASPHAYADDAGTNQAQCILMREYTTVTVNNGITWTCQAWDQNIGGELPFFAFDTSVVGTITGSGRGFLGGAGRTAVDGPAYTGEGSGAASALGVANPDGNGGGMSNILSAGGGNATTTNKADGAFGSADFNQYLTLMGMGGGGAGAASSYGGTAGGNGGAVITIISRKLTVTGHIYSNGSNGVACASNQRAGAGGAGGCILMKTLIGNIGSGIITATGGLAGTGSSNNQNTDGSTGRIHIDYGVTYTGTTNPSIDYSQQKSFIPRAPISFFL